MAYQKRRTIPGPSFFVGIDGNGIISFGSGRPDLPPPREIYDILRHYRSYKYGLIMGEKNLLGALSVQYPGAHPGDFVVTNGASEALDLIFRVIARRSSKKYVLLPKPYYYSYPFLVRFAGLKPLYTNLKDDRIDLADFRKKIGRCAAALINSPSNPTGMVESVATLKEIESITKRSGVPIVSDEVYKDLIYERENYLLAGKHIITVNSFSKTYAMSGLRVGYLYARDPDIIRRVIEMKVHTSMNTSIIAQDMACAALLVPREYIERQRKIWEGRRDVMYAGLLDLGFDVSRPEGAFYVLPKIKHANKVVNDLYYNHKVIVYDGAWFGAPNHIRLSYALDASKIEEGLKRIGQYLKRHPKLV